MLNTPLTENYIESHEWRWVWAASISLMVLLLIPLVWAFASANPGMVFTGHLTEIEEGASHFAQMARGYGGSWVYTVPFTPEAHEGVGLFTFYLALGHAARLLGVSPVLLYHTMRLFGTLLMSVAIYQFMSLWTVDITQRRLAWGIAMFGGGLGWLPLLLGGDIMTSPEVFVMQGAYAHAHLPWIMMALALVATVLINAFYLWPDRQPELDHYTIGLVAAVLLLIGTTPFVLVPFCLAFGVVLLRRWRKTGVLPSRELAWFILILIVALPVGVYLLWVFTASDPVIIAWLRAIIRPSPNPLIAFLPLIACAAFGLWAARRRWEETDLLLVIWVVSALVLAYIPVGFQRFFLTGIMLPLAVLAARGIYRVIGKVSNVAAVAAFVALLPTSLLAYGVPFVAQPATAYITDDQQAALVWVQNSLASDVVLLAAPETSLIAPSYGPQVVYAGLNTLDADRRQTSVIHYYDGTDCTVVTSEGVDYIFVGPEEQHLLSSDACLPTSEPIYQNDTVTIYED